MIGSPVPTECTSACASARRNSRCSGSEGGGESASRAKFVSCNDTPCTCTTPSTSVRPWRGNAGATTAAARLLASSIARVSTSTLPRNVESIFLIRISVSGWTSSRTALRTRCAARSSERCRLSTLIDTTSAAGSVARVQPLALATTQVDKPRPAKGPATSIAPVRSSAMTMSRGAAAIASVAHVQVMRSFPSCACVRQRPGPACARPSSGHRPLRRACWCGPPCPSTRYRTPCRGRPTCGGWEAQDSRSPSRRRR